MSTPDANADAAELAKFGALATEWWDPEGPFKTLHDINPLRLGFIEARATLDGVRVLDVGCGGGLLSEALAARGARVTGLDLAEQNLSAARAHAAQTGSSVDYRCEAVEAVAAAEPGAFDVIVCLELLEHVPDPQSVIAACAAAARPGADLFFSTINRNIKSFTLGIVAAESVLGMLPRGTHEYTKLIRPAELARGARGAGLDVRELAGMHFNPLTREYWLGGNVDVNYLVHARKPVGR